MSLVRPLSPNLKEGIDRKTLKTLKKRFLEVNEGRLDRTLNALSDRHRVFLQALPILIHVNHPILPGYISGKTPCGISQFEADKHQIRAAQTIDKGFQYKRDANKTPSIYSIALMGSAGTVAYSKKSDMDFWVVHRPGLNQSALDELRKKLDAIQRWTETMGMEVYFFLIDPDKFRRGERGEQLDAEDCGSTQHYLLLDEFYRTSLLIAGRYPVWWLVPSDQEGDYEEIASTLVNKRFIEKDEVFDIGGISDFPAGEFLGAGLWQLYKGIDSPYKSVLKILLTEVYASEYPAVSPLSLIYKKAIYDGKLDLDELDPYVLVYRKIEAYLREQKEKNRLELARRCLYFKVNQPLTKPITQKKLAWQNALMTNLTKEWKWDQSKLHTLDTRAQWKVNRVISERKAVVNELNLSYRFLSRFARENHSKAHVNHRDMTLLGRKLYAAFERKSGKVELVNPGIAPDISESHLSFYYEAPTDEAPKPSWVMYREYIQPNEKTKQDPVKRSRSIIELIAWAYFNKLITEQTRYFLESPGSDMTDHELQRIVQSFFQLFPDRLPAPEQEHFEKLAVSKQAAIFINVGRDPMASMSKKGIQRLSNHTDALKYSGLQNNLVLQIDQLFVNSWNEVTVNQFSESTSIIDCLVDLLRNHPPKKVKKLPKLDIRCYCPSRPIAIAKRVKELFYDVIKAFYTNPFGTRTRYVLEFESHFFMLHFDGNQPRAKALKNYGSLVRYLSRPIDHYSPILLDRYALEGSVLSVLAASGLPHCVQIFYLKKEESADVYVLDEKSTLFTFKTDHFKDTAFMNQMRRFVASALNRQAVDMGQSEDDREQIDINFYELMPAQNGQPLHSVERFVSKGGDNDNYYNVQVIVDHDSSGKSLHTIYCDHQEFSELEFGKNLFGAVAEHIRSIRESDANYPMYITDIDLTRTREKLNNERPLQISEYLQHKQKLETLLNNALYKSVET